MSTEADRQATNVTPPQQSDTPGVGVTILAATTTAANATLPDAFMHRYVDFVAEGDKIWVTFSGPAETDDVDKSLSGGSTFAAGTNDQNGVPIPDGQRLSVRLDPTTSARVSWQANAANSKLIVYPSSQASRR